MRVREVKSFSQGHVASNIAAKEKLITLLNVSI